MEKLTQFVEWLTDWETHPGAFIVQIVLGWLMAIGLIVTMSILYKWWHV